MKNNKLIYAIGLLGLLAVSYGLPTQLGVNLSAEFQPSTRQHEQTETSKQTNGQILSVSAQSKTAETTQTSRRNATTAELSLPANIATGSEIEDASRGKVEKFARILDDHSWLGELSYDATGQSYDRSVQLSDFIYQNEQLAAYSPQMECGKQLCGLLFQDVKTLQDADLIVSEVNRSSIRGPFMHHVMKPLSNGQYKVRIMLPVSHDSSVIETLLPQLSSQQ